jgi:hypothetical protein
MRLITGAIAAIAVTSWLVFFFGVLWILIGTGLAPWQIVIGPAIVVGLVGAGLILKVVESRKG